MVEHGSQLISPQVLGQLHSLQVMARTIVEGARAGAHRSPLRGQSVDFRDHRPYVAGDDTRHLDWKVLARRDRLVVKRYEAEIDLSCTVVVDGSNSMAYQGDRALMSKYRYTSVIAASLGYLIANQNDRIGLVLYGDDIISERKPARQGQFDRICHDLEEHNPSDGTDAGSCLARLAAPSTRRGLIVWCTDGLEDPADLITTLDRLRYRGHDVALVWVLDPDEADLGVASVSRFMDLEGEGQLVAEPRSLRDAYQQEVEAHRLALQEACLARRVAFVPCTTDQLPSRPLNEVLMALQRDR